MLIAENRPAKWEGPACIVILLAIVAGSFLLRTCFVFGQIFSGPDVLFCVNDSWHHVRLVQNLVHHFPRSIDFDPYSLFDGGMIDLAPFFDWFLAGISLLVGWGKPSPRTVNMVCAYVPPILGALTSLPVYLLGRRLFGRWAGLVAAGVLALCPGQVMTRSLLGYCDHHVAEWFFSTLTILAAVGGLAYARRAEATLAALRSTDRGIAVRMMMMGILAGVAMGLYLLSWTGGSMFVGILVIWILVQFLVDVSTGRPTDYLVLLVLPMFVVALAALALSRTHLLAVQYQLIAVGGGHLKSIIPEAAPLLKGDDGWSLRPAWVQFATVFFLSVPGLIVMLYRGVRRGEAVALLIGIWTLGMLGATLGQSRFSYYYAINAALLATYTVLTVLGWGWNKLNRPTSPVAPRKPHRAGREKPIKPQTSPSSPSRLRGLKIAYLGGGVAVVALGLFYPNIDPAFQAARKGFTLSSEWVETLRWMRENTPEPFGNPQSYYDRYEAPAPNEPYNYPASAYSIMCSWGYGYWITGLGHRIPVTNASQKWASAASDFYLDLDEQVARSRLDRRGARYVVVDSTMPYMEVTPGGGSIGVVKSLAHWAEIPMETLQETWRQRQPDGSLHTFDVFLPRYYQSILARLYIFRGRSFEPTEVYVMTYRLARTAEGEEYKEYVSHRTFRNYKEAQAYYDSLPPQVKEASRLVGVSPYESCVPLEPLESFRLVYQSPKVRGIGGRTEQIRGQPVHMIEVYEYTGWKPKYRGEN